MRLCRNICSLILFGQEIKKFERCPGEPKEYTSIYGQKENLENCLNQTLVYVSVFVLWALN